MAENVGIPSPNTSAKGLLDSYQRVLADLRNKGVGLSANSGYADTKLEPALAHLG
jgi:hypothetical protein